MLACPRHLLSRDPGEDFFYHTEARLLVCTLLCLSLTLFADAQWFGR